MRLTLQTLLAYLDDTLEPAQAKLIGQKISESEPAQQLMKRIKEVTRRQDLNVPSSGPEAPVDLNTVAEYLDNTLAPEKAAEVEEVGQKSDIYLAELAACHQILSLLASEPAKVPQPARERMYALTKGRAAARRAGVAAAIAGAGDEPPRRAEAAEAAAGEPTSLGRLVPLAGVVALLLALGFIIWQLLPGGSTPRTDSQYVLVGDSRPSPATPETASTPRASPPTGGKPEPEKPEPVKPVEPPKPPPEQTPADSPSKERRELGKFQPVAKAPGSVLVTRPAGSDTWEAVAPQGPVFSAQPLVSLPGNRSMLQLAGGAGILMWGSVPEFLSLQGLRQRQEMPVVESVATLHAPQAPNDVDLTLHEGRVVFSNTRPTGEVRIHLRLQGQAWDLTLVERGTEVSVEACGRYLSDTSFSKTPDGGKPLEEMLLIVLKGQASLKVHFNVYGMPESSFFYWNNRAPDAGGPRPMPQLPDWYVKPALAEDIPGSRELAAAVQELAARFNQKDTAVAKVLDEFRQDANLGRRMLAIYCIGAIDDLSRLVDSLEDKRPDVRQMAIQVLRHWIGVSGERDLELYKFLHQKKGYSEQQADNVLQLLHTFSAEDIARPETYDLLINYLLLDKVAIRELANWHLVRMMPQGTKVPPFDATGSTDQRITAYKAWKELIPDGKLPPRAGG